MPPPPSTGNEMTLIDTNVILRYILNDIPEQAVECLRLRVLPSLAFRGGGVYSGARLGAEGGE